MSTESYQRLKQLMTCFVCYNKYSANCKPKWLLCKHYFCQQCLANIQEKGLIKCPLCRQLQFYSEESSVQPDAVVHLMERASNLLARLKTNERLKRELETAKMRKIQMWDERERKLEADLANFRQSPSFKDFSALQFALALIKSQVISPASRDRIDFYSDFQDKLEQYLRNSASVTHAQVISWIEGWNNQITAQDFTDYHFIRALTAAIINCSISKHRGGINTIRTSVLKHWAPILKRFVNSEIVSDIKFKASSMEMKLILAVQELTSQKKYRKGLTLDILNAFGEHDVFLSCFDAIRKTSGSTQSADSELAFYIVSCLPQGDKSKQLL